MTRNFAVYPSLSEKTVFVTGGALGIGAEIVSAFAKQVAKVGFEWKSIDEVWEKVNEELDELKEAFNKVYDFDSGLVE